MIRNERKAGAVLSYINILLNTIITLLYTPFVLRTLGQSEFGLYSLAISIIGYLIILDLGLGNTIIVFTSKFIEKNEKEKEKTLHGTVFAIYLFMSLLSVFIGLFLYQEVDYFFSNSMSIEEIEKLKIMLLILTINVAITFPFSIFTSILNAYEKFIFIKVISILKSLLIPIILVPILLLGYKSIAMIVGITVINLACLVISFIYCKYVTNLKISPFNFNYKTLKIIFNYSIFIFISMIVEQINWNSGQFIIGSFMGSKAVSVYAIAILINTTFMILSTTISGVMLPKISKFVSMNVTNKTLTDEMIKVGRLQYYIIFLILTGFIIFGKDFIILWAGNEYLDAYYLTIIIMIPLSIPLIQNLGLSILQAKNQFSFKAIVTLIGAFFNISFSIYFINKLGYFGVAYTFSSTILIFNCFIMNIFYHNKLNLNMLSFWKNIINMTIPLGFLALSIAYAKFYINGLLPTLILVVAYVISYIIISYYFNMNKYEKNMILSVIKGKK